MNINNEILTIIYTMKADKTKDSKEYVELHEKEIIKLFSYNPENLIEDEFTLNLIDRVYKRVRTDESDKQIVDSVNSWCRGNGIDLGKSKKE